MQENQVKCTSILNYVLSVFHMGLQDYLEKETGQRTVPSVWIKQKFIGGSSDLAAISEDELLQMIN